MKSNFKQMKNRKLNQWFWKWHFIAGIISLPFVLVLSITGAIYLFKSNVENEVINKVKQVEKSTNTKLSFGEQLVIAQAHETKRLNAMVVPTSDDESTEFVSGRFSHKKSVFINPNTGKVTGKFSPKDTWMYKVRKLHGELLGGKFGTKIVELVASWMVVLILTGLYIWFPFKRGIKGILTIRFKEGRRTLFRDIHAVTGFWISILLLIVLAGGFPWTDVFGGNFKWVQKVTNTGYPKTWRGIGLESKIDGGTIFVDEMVRIAKAQNLSGEVSIGFPKSPKSTFTVSNKTFPLSEQKMLHFDQYSGALVKAHNWSDVGILMRARMWVMAFHQGQFGGWNFWLMFAIATLLAIMSLAGLFSYLSRKPDGKIGVPSTPKNFSVGIPVIIIIGVLAIVFPLFGVSLLFIILYEQLKKRTQSTIK